MLAVMLTSVGCYTARSNTGIPCVTECSIGSYRFGLGFTALLASESFNTLDYASCVSGNNRSPLFVAGYDIFTEYILAARLTFVILMIFTGFALDKNRYGRNAGNVVSLCRSYGFIVRITAS